MLGLWEDHMCTEISLKEVKKVRTVHNVQQVVTVEDMGRNVPRIYAPWITSKLSFSRT
jgi:hypothetical protein